MRTYLILKERAAQFRHDAEIQTLLAEINAPNPAIPAADGNDTRAHAAALKAYTFDRRALGRRGMSYERLDQLVADLLLGVR
jgi:xylose isomerase